MSRSLSLIAVLAAAPLAAAADRPDLLVADFEGDTYGPGWTTAGTAFGTGPARGTLPNQMPVSGFLGKGLVNSFLGGDAATGTLTSPEFKVGRKYLNFLVGGGRHPGKACVNLLVGGKVVRTATGPNDRPGGTEHLDWATWDVAEFEGRAAVLQIVDDERGGWGHVNVDHVIQSDAKKQAEPAARTLAVDRTYLHLPVRNGAPMRRVKFTVAGETVREFDIELATDGNPDFWAFADVTPFKGKRLAVEAVLPSGSKALDALTLSDALPDAEQLYREKHRPLFHFTSRRGWLNDPNGLVFHTNEWHLFYQHNPYGTKWGNMHWGHAVSRDLVRWNELGDALYPRKYGDWAFSGSAVVDKTNTSGWGTKEKPPLVLAYTSTGRGECVAFSTDDGRTWTEYEKNPVVRHSGRDPKLVWYEPGRHWVMAVYDEYEGKQWIAFHTSKDLKTWQYASRIEGFYECPDLFEMELVGGNGQTKWVLYAADGKYLVGDFDGKQFKPDFKEKQQLWYGRFYAAQTFSNAPPYPTRFPRHIQIGWAQGVTFPGMPFDQQMTVPVDLMLSPAIGDIRPRPSLVAMPAGELHDLRHEKPAFDSNPNQVRTIKAPESFTLADDVDVFDLEVVPHADKGTGFSLDLRGTTLVYDPVKQTLSCKDVTAKLADGVFEVPGTRRLRVLVDRGSIEVFADGGRVAMSVAAVPDEKNRKVVLAPTGGPLKLLSGTIHRMKSAWGK